MTLSARELVDRRAKPEPVVTHRALRVWVALVTLSVFGPYVTGQVRTEQIAVFGSAVLAVFLAIPYLKTRSFAPFPFLFWWGALLAVIAAATAFPPVYKGGFTQHPVLGGMAAFLLPVALIVLTYYWTCLAPADMILRTIATAVVAAMTLNAVLSIYQVKRSAAVVFSWLPAFWSSDNGGPITHAGGSVALSSAGNGRFLGIFNQPAESGVAYGVALFCLIYLVEQKSRHGTLVVALLLLVGGLLSVSKIFVLGAVPVAAYMVMRRRGRRGRVVVGASVVALAYLYLGGTGALPNWAGSRMLSALFNPNGQFLSTFSAGRFGQGGTLNSLGGSLLRLSPLTGFGVGGVVAPYDSLWVEVLAVSGLIGLGIVLVVFWLLWHRWMQLKVVLDARVRRLAGCTLLLAFGGAFGVPTLTGNRITTLLWLILGVTLVCTAPPPVEATARSRTASRP